MENEYLLRREKAINEFITFVVDHFDSLKIYTMRKIPEDQIKDFNISFDNLISGVAKMGFLQGINHEITEMEKKKTKRLREEHGVPK